MNEEAYYTYLIACGVRYFNMQVRNDERDVDLMEFTKLFIKECVSKLPLMKLNRWLGYIQGTLIAQNYTTVQEERDWTRPYFRPLDFDE
jgi:hypothetical protein